MSDVLWPRQVVFYQHAIFNGGIERVIFELAAEMILRGIRVEIVVNQPTIFFGEMSPPKGLTLHVLNAKGFFARLGGLKAYLKKNRPDVLISTGHFSNEVAALTKLSKGVATKVITSEHTALAVELRSLSWKSPRRYLVPLFARLTYDLPDALMAVSNGVQRDAEKLFGRKPGSIRTIYNPVDFSWVKKRSLEPLDHPWLAPGQPPVILGIGRLELQKDFATLLRALVEVRKHRPARLILLGIGSQEAALKVLAAELGLAEAVAFMGFQSNPYPYLKQAAVFALSSQWEGLGIVLIEALSLGTPIVSTDCPSGPYEVLDGGKYGKLVPMKSPRALAEALLGQLDQPHTAPPAQALARFDVATVVDQYLNLAAGK
jgi:glycosyltransferase involved in cell wall biosynthesis